MRHSSRLAGPCLLLITLSAATAAAQKHEGPDAFDPSSTGGEITIELDTARGRNADRSLLGALAASAVLPGAGEAYLGETRSATSFLLAEAGFWAGFFISLEARDSHLQSARNYASQYAGADAAGQGPSYLERLATYRSYREKEHRQDSYELAQVLAGKDVALMPDWDFGSSGTPENTARWRDYQSIMRHYRGAKVAMSFAVGAMALNRVASVAHTLRVYRRTSGKGLSALPPSPRRVAFVPEFGMDGSALRMTLSF
jgi:hypothetical protein